MINWTNLLFNTLWIAALALALAVLNHAALLASEHSARIREELAAPGHQRALNLAGFLFSLGLALTSGSGWEKSIWFLLAALFLINLTRPLLHPDP